MQAIMVLLEATGDERSSAPSTRHENKSIQLRTNSQMRLLTIIGQLIGHSNRSKGANKTTPSQVANTCLEYGLFGRVISTIQPDMQVPLDLYVAAIEVCTYLIQSHGQGPAFAQHDAFVPLALQTLARHQKQVDLHVSCLTCLATLLQRAKLGVRARAELHSRDRGLTLLMEALGRFSTIDTVQTPLLHTLTLLCNDGECKQHLLQMGLLTRVVDSANTLNQHTSILCHAFQCVAVLTTVVPDGQALHLGVVELTLTAMKQHIRHRALVESGLVLLSHLFRRPNRRSVINRLLAAGGLE